MALSAGKADAKLQSGDLQLCNEYEALAAPSQAQAALGLGAANSSALNPTSRDIADGLLPPAASGTEDWGTYFENFPIDTKDGAAKGEGEGSGYMQVGPFAVPSAQAASAATAARYYAHEPLTRAPASQSVVDAPSILVMNPLYQADTNGSSGTDGADYNFYQQLPLGSYEKSAEPLYSILPGYGAPGARAGVANGHYQVPFAPADAREESTTPTTLLTF